MEQFSSKNMLGFTFQDVAREFPEKNRVHLAGILADIVDNGTPENKIMGHPKT